MGRRAFSAYTLVGALLAAGYFALPGSGTAHEVWTLCVGLSSVAAIVVGVRLNEPAAPRAWHLVALGQLLFVAGAAVALVYSLLHRETPYPSTGDVLHVAAYPAIGAGLLLMLRARSPGRDAANLIDAAIATTGIALFSWIFLIEPYVDGDTLTGHGNLLAALYPLLDLALAAVAARILIGAGFRVVSYSLLGCALLLQLAGDGVYLLEHHAGLGWRNRPRSRLARRLRRLGARRPRSVDGEDHRTRLRRGGGADEGAARRARARHAGNPTADARAVDQDVRPQHLPDGHGLDGALRARDRTACRRRHPPRSGEAARGLPPRGRGQPRRHPQPRRHLQDRRRHGPRAERSGRGDGNPHDSLARWPDRDDRRRRVRRSHRGPRRTACRQRARTGSRGAPRGSRRLLQRPGRDRGGRAPGRRAPDRLSAHDPGGLRGRPVGTHRRAARFVATAGLCRRSRPRSHSPSRASRSPRTCSSARASDASAGSCRTRPT